MQRVSSRGALTIFGKYVAPVEISIFWLSVLIFPGLRPISSSTMSVLTGSHPRVKLKEAMKQ